MHSTTRIIFFQVNSNPEKLKKIVEIASLHFGRKERLLIAVEEEQAEKFVDDLLWKMPKTSFLPHVVSAAAVPDFITITNCKKNLNGAHIAFNLCPTSLFLDTPLKIIYEFEDLSSPSKKNLSSQRFDAYKRAGFSIEAQ